MAVEGAGAPVIGRAEEEQSDAQETFQETVAALAVEWIKSILLAFALFLVVRTFLVEAYRIPTGSMEETLLVGDFLLVNKAAYRVHLPFTHKQLPARGDIVEFVPPHVKDQNYVKRLAGSPGDTVEMRNKKLYVNNVAQDETYARYSDMNDRYAADMVWQCAYSPAELTGGACRPTRDNWGPIVVPPGQYLMLGDNRDDSEDSRYWGFVPRDAIKGRPVVVYYSFDQNSHTRVPWLTAIRWSRIGTRPH